MIDVMLELEEIGKDYKSANFSAALEKLWILWEKIPDPKETTLNAYLILEYGVAIALKVRDPNEAKKWAAYAQQFVKVRGDGGEVELLLGKVAFECGEIKIAKQNFIAADKKSRGRALQGVDPKYRSLIRPSWPRKSS